MIKNIKKKEGMSSINIVFMIFVTIIVLSFFMDLILIGTKYSIVASVNSNLSRTASVQGGILTSAPNGYQGGNTNYVSSYKMYSLIKDNLNNVGVENSEFRIKINGRNFTTSGSNRIDYLDLITTEIEVTHEWTFVSNFIPGLDDATINSRRTVMSEFKYNYDSWIGE